MSAKSKSLFCLFPVILLVLLLGVIPASAERIIPNNQVMTHVKVRHRPSIDSPAVGRLRRNESAELIESVPYWYYIRLDNGVPGYVSKAWAQPLSDAEASGEVIRVGSWNITRLADGTSADFQLIAQVIEANFDVLAVTGVMQVQGEHPGYNALLGALGSGWAGMITNSPRPNTTSGNSKYYAILYRSAVVCPCAKGDRLVYYKDNDGSGMDSGPDYFSREPAFGCFKAPMNKASAGIDFLLAAYEARGEGGDVSETKAEVDHIDDVFAAMEAARPSERDIIIAGDFNLVPANLQQVVDVLVKTRGAGSTLNSEGELTTNLYDHILILDEQATSEMIDTPQVIDVRGIAPSNLDFYRLCSDHLPVVIRLRACGPDDDS